MENKWQVIEVMLHAAIQSYHFSEDSLDNVRVHESMVVVKDTSLVNKLIDTIMSMAGIPEIEDHYYTLLPKYKNVDNSKLRTKSHAYREPFFFLLLDCVDDGGKTKDFALYALKHWAYFMLNPDKLKNKTVTLGSI